MAVSTVHNMGGNVVQDAFAMVENTPGPAGDGIRIRATTAGNVTLTLLSGRTIPEYVAVGSNIFPYAVTKATNIDAVIADYYGLLSA